MRGKFVLIVRRLIKRKPEITIPRHQSCVLSRQGHWRVRNDNVTATLVVLQILVFSSKPVLFTSQSSQVAIPFILKRFLAAFSGRDRVECACSILPRNRTSLLEYYKKSSQTENIQHQTPNPLTTFPNSANSNCTLLVAQGPKNLELPLFLFLSYPTFSPSANPFEFYLQNIFII